MTLRESHVTRCRCAFATAQTGQGEIRVRQAAGLGSGDLGKDLMRKAFKPGKGPLADTTQVVAEQEGIASLFAGAIASFKNPGSHRNVTLDDPVEVAELIMLADLLIRITERRKAAVP